MKKVLSIVFMFMIATIGFALGQEAASGEVVAAPDLGASIVALIEAFKGGAAPAAIIVAVMQLLKTEFLGNLIGKLHAGVVPLLVLLLGLASGVLMDIGAGTSWLESLVKGLFNGGGALALYAVVVKHFVKKKV